MLTIKDRDGVLPVSTMKLMFEQTINQTAALKRNTGLGTFEINGEFSHYVEPDTDTMWLGFALGMRCAERLLRAGLGDGVAP
jgi:hypothetical protein